METQMKMCLSCGKENVVKEYTKFCMHCGKPLFNTCDNYQCELNEEILPDDASYCPACGDGTLFLKYGVIRENNSADTFDDLPF